MTAAQQICAVECAGLFDLQVNGFAGVDFNNPALTVEGLSKAAEAMRATGVTRFLPTLISSSFDRFAACARIIARAHVPAIAGIHMEGPYICSADGPRGAHRSEDVTVPTIDDFQRRQDAANGCIRLVTLAPEVPGALRLVEYLADCGIRVAIGHTTASSEQIKDAIAAGATLSTHLGNGCAGMLPRHPNLIWDQLAADELAATFLVDGHHLPPATVKAMIRAKTLAGSILVTDATAAAGSPPGVYSLGRLTIELDGTGQVRAAGRAHLAGSALTLDNAVSNTVRFTGLAVEDVLPLASVLPARAVGLEPTGRIAAAWHPAACQLRIVSVQD